MRSSIISILKIVFTLLVCFLLVSKIDLHQFYLSLVNVNPAYLILSTILWPVSLIISSLRWKVVLDSYGIKVKLNDLFDLYWIGAFFNNFLPSSFGGDGYKAYYLNKRFRNRKTIIVSSLVIERGMGFLALIVTGLIAGFSFLNIVIGIPVVLLLYSMQVVGLIVFTTVLVVKPEIKFGSSNSFLSKISAFLNSIQSFGENRQAMLTSMVYSVLFVIISIFSTYLIFLAFGVTVQLGILFLVLPMIHFSELVPFTINSLGIKEGLAVYLFTLFSLDPAVVLSVFVVTRIMLLLMSLTGGLRFSAIS